MSQLTVQEALRRASCFLSHVDAPRLTAELLLAHELGWSREKLLASLADPLSMEHWMGFQRLIQRRAAGEPLQYITGVQEFFGLPFFVNPSVLIPRPETELLVEQLLHHCERLWPGSSRRSLQVADVGTGSGAIAVTLAHQRPRWRVEASDISPYALEVARSNAIRLLGTAKAIRWRLGDGLWPWIQEQAQVDLLVSNPPYISRSEWQQLEAHVRDYEPRSALIGGEDGLKYYREWIPRLPQVLRTPGLVAFEVGMGQAGQVARWLEEAGLEPWVEKDWAGIERMVWGKQI